MTARDEMLGRIRSALGPIRRSVDIPRDYHRAGHHPPGSPNLLDQFEDRLVDYRATVHRTIIDDVPALMSRLMAEAGPVVVPPGFPSEWAPHATVDSGQSATELDAFGTVATLCAAAVAETGTIVLDAGPGQGRRALSLIPDQHVCVVRTSQVVQSVPELLTRLTPTRPLTFISGPSATSDIELRRVEGVHGPRTLVVVLVSSVS